MNFKAYDILSSLVPGFIVLMVLLNFVNIEYNKDEELAKLEKEARKKIIGLWSHPNPVALGILEENKNLLEFFVLTNYYFTGG